MFLQVLEPMQRLSYEKLAIQSNKGRSRRQGQTDVTPISGNGTLVFDALSKEREEQGIKLFKEMWSSLKGPAGTIFHILSFQSIYELPNEEGYKPCEVACIKYSIERGIIGEWHQFINPGAIELGLRAEVQVHTEKTHRISEDLYSQGRDDYRNIWKELFLFTGSDVENNLLCMENEIRKNCFCLHWLAEKAGLTKFYLCYTFSIFSK
uniref:protein maelstrom homolog n=1 Tax=Ciona intestinalis TaxID=7719 RepID=UPI000EF500B6|nr:protein maelstrom homolog [Ciona intestinalis]|eukprot:XP_026693499.1 protein maelstrom homolog [Ciona intestinalis]